MESSQKMRIVLTNTIHPKGMEILEPLGDVVLPADETNASLLIAVRDADALLVRRKLPDNILENAPRMQVIVRHGVGVDYIPVEAATQKGVLVANVPGANTEAVVEHVIGVMLLLARSFHRLDISKNRTGWGIRNIINAVELRGKTLGVVGFGRIGGRVGKICREAFSMELLVYDPFYPGTEIEEYKTDLETLFSKSDFVTLHTPLYKETKGFVNASLLSKMKKTAYLINAARGELVNESELARALATEIIAGAALDVFEDEPISPKSPLLELDNVILTPHSAALTTESMIEMSRQSAEEVERVLRGSMPLNIVNPDVIEFFKKRFR